MFNLTTAEKVFRDQVPQDFLERSLRCLFSSCQQAKEFCEQSFPRPEAHDLRGHWCRAVFEKEWRAIAVQSPHMHGRALANKRGTYYHTRITSGSVILTASQVSNPKVIVRSADFRNGLARSAQTEMFGSDDPPAPDAPLYAILLYGLDKSRTFPVFADIVFPDANCKRYVDRICLFREFAALVNQLSGGPQAPAQSEPDVTVRKIKARKAT